MALEESPAEDEARVADAADGSPLSLSYVQPPESQVATDAKSRGSAMPFLVLVVLVLIGGAGLYLGLR
jgi:hypothetical protein